MDTFIIDAYNLIHRVDELRVLLQQSQDICISTMVSKLQAHFFGVKIKVVLVFDGYGINQIDKNIHVKFSKTDTGMDYGNADGLIKHLVNKSKNPKLLKIISSDKDITFYAKSCGCRISSSETFWGEIKDKRYEKFLSNMEQKEKPEYVTKGEVEYFLKKFTNTDDSNTN